MTDDPSREIHHRVSRAVTRFHMFQPGHAVLIGVSGGPDSVALVSVMTALAPRFGLRLGIAHLHHMLRGTASDEDARFVADLARRHGIPYHMERRDVRRYKKSRKLSLEEAARQVRYDFFDAIAQEHGYDTIALGHHADDNAEQVLMALLRGSGPAGLSGIPPVRAGRIVRPLIDVTRAELIDYLDACGIPYRVDATNTDIRFLRNRVRHCLLPSLLREYNPRFIQTLNRLADILREDEAWLASLVTPLYEQCMIRQEKDAVDLSVPEIRRLPPGARRRIIRRALEQVRGNLRRITFTHVEEITGLLDSSSGSARFLDLPDQVRVSCSGDRLRIARAALPLRTRPPVSPPPLFRHDVTGPGTVSLPEIGASLVFSRCAPEHLPVLQHTGQNVAFFDMDKLDVPMVIRNIRPGDRFIPLGMRGTQKVKTYFINRKVPAETRRRCPVLVCRGEIIWLAGHRIADPVKVTASTRTVLRVELLLS